VTTVGRRNPSADTPSAAIASSEVGSMSIVTLTELAAAKVRELLARDGRQGSALRLSVSGSGCSGLRYPLKFDERAGELRS